jgi:hypothetical protein
MPDASFLFWFFGEKENSLENWKISRNKKLRNVFTTQTFILVPQPLRKQHQTAIHLALPFKYQTRSNFIVSLWLPDGVLVF